MQTQTVERKLETTIRRNFQQELKMQSTSGIARLASKYLCVLIFCLICLNNILATLQHVAPTQVGASRYLLSLSELCSLRPNKCADYKEADCESFVLVPEQNRVVCVAVADRRKETATEEKVKRNLNSDESDRIETELANLVDLLLVQTKRPNERDVTKREETTATPTISNSNHNVADKDSWGGQLSGSAPADSDRPRPSLAVEGASQDRLRRASGSLIRLSADEVRQLLASRGFGEGGVSPQPVTISLSSLLAAAASIVPTAAAAPTRNFGWRSSRSPASPGGRSWSFANFAAGAEQQTLRARLHRSQSPPGLGGAEAAAALPQLVSAAGNQTLVGGGILEPPEANSEVPRRASAQKEEADGESGGELTQCNLRKFSYRASKSDESGNNKCWGKVTATICYGGCDSGEIADWLFPYKKSIHKVNEELRDYNYVDAVDCVCKRCASADMACLGSMSTPELRTRDEDLD